MTTKHANYGIQFKALPDANGKTGLFEAIVSVTGNVDLVGDKVMPGAFTKTIREWQESGDPIPVVWSHDWADPHAILGSIDANHLEETPVGLKAIGTIDLSNPFAAQVHSLMKQRLVKEFSFSYVIRDERTGKDGSNELWDLQLIEVGPTLKGANPETELIGVKSMLEAAAKAGRSISSKNESKIRQAMTLLEEVMKSVEATNSAEDDGAKSEEHIGANDEELLRFKAELAALSVLP